MVCVVFCCLLSSQVMQPISLCSCVLSQQYEVRVYDEFVIRDNTAVLKCHIPSFVRDYVTTTAWFRDDGLVIHVDGTQVWEISGYREALVRLRSSLLQKHLPIYLNPFRILSLALEKLD
ncbi:hypothetical protein AVEN_237705-1 [Araneus ventricosus]|uniref:Ig-like domain-containing protein n=1 Tax=Araneus ventricosus TaxID=182803 RepID=A0A4Y2ENP7_ARAVE|nr:hypothetical protein AVEN_237705-1 [Araneus ventricosus]